MIEFITRIYNFIRYDIWRIAENELSKSRRLSYRFIKIIVLATRGFISERLSVKASALTYSILFAIVPVIALLIAVGRGFGVENLIETWLEQTFVAQVDMIPTIMQFVTRYLETTQGGLFIGIGIVVLIISVINFFIQVELAFNEIWQVKKSRSVLKQFSIYFSSIFILPVLIILSSGVSIYFNAVVSKSFIVELLSPILRFGVKFAPYLLNWIFFSLLYLAVPNTKVKLINALIAGIIAGTAFQVFQMLYINGQVYLSRYNVVYGGFAAIPLLLLWLQISCLIVLLGAEISYASQNIQYFEFEIDAKNISPRYKNTLILFITYVIIKQFEGKKPPLSAYQIVSEYSLPSRLVNQILMKLIDVKIIIEVFNEENKDKTYQPAFDINQLTVSLLYDKIESFGSENFLNTRNELLDQFWHKTSDLVSKSGKMSDSILIKDI